MTSNHRPGRRRVGMLAFLLLAVGMFMPMLASAVGMPSTYPGCANRTATVAWGGTVNVNLTTCHFFGLGVVSTAPTHGTATPGDPAPIDTYNYNHNGSSPAGGGTDTFVVLDDNSDFITVTVTIQAPTSPIAVDPASLSAMSAGTPFSQTLSSAGGLAPYTYTLQSGTLPIGLTLSGGGVISGTPTQRGGYGFTVRSTDATVPTAQFTDKGYSGTVDPAPLSITPASATAAQSAPFSQTLTISGGVAPHSCLLESGSFPAGISISSGCVISGTTTDAPGNYPVTIRVTDSSTGVGSHFELESFTFTVSALPNLTINDVTLSEGNAGITNFSFTVSLSAPAGPGGVTFDIATANGTATAGVDYVASSFTSQTIPAGSSTYFFTVMGNGDLLNEPTETFFVNVTNVVNATVVDGQGVGTITNDDPLPSLSIDDVSVVEGNAGTVNAVFTVTLNAASGQTVSVNYATADGTATQPADYTSTSGTLTFTPGQTTRTITVPVIGETVPEANETFFVNLSGATNATISDNQGQGTITNDDVPVSVSPPSGSLTGGTVAAAYSQTFTGSGGTGPYTFAVTAGTLPVNMLLSAGGVLSGTPTGGGSFNFTITATDSSASPGPYAGSQSYTLVIASPTLVLAPSTLPDGTRTVAYSDVLTASGGTAPYSYAVTAGALPGGLTLTTGGVLSGTPTATGTFNFSVTATDSSTGTGPYSVTRNYTMVVADAAPVASNSVHTVAYGSANNTVPLSLSGGPVASLAITTPAAHGTAVVSGTTIQYTPTAGYAGGDSFAYTATNPSGTSSPATVTLTVSPPTLVVSPSTAQTATVGTAYSRTFTWSGGTAPYTSLQVQNLPAGLSVTATTSTTVTVSGTPTVAGTASLNLTATDSSTGTGPFNGTQTVSLTVGAPTVTLAPTSLPDASAYSAYNQSITAAGGLTPHTYAVTAGSLPPGLTLSTAGVLSGTAGAPGTYNFTVTATDASGAAYTGNQAYTLQVVMAQTYSGPSPTGSGTITATFSGGGATCVFASARFIPLTGDAASPPANSAPPGVQFPHGLFDFATTGCTPGSTLQFTITYPGALPNGAQYWKYGPTPASQPGPSPRWYTLPAAVAGTVVTFSITDGALGDDDLTANGAVVDAGGPGFGQATAVPVGDGLLWWLALGMLAVAAWQRRRGAA
ncbi:putative Ig domain-containing protein [Acidovorax sp. JMULE5]|uniref:putative Ig domain-containing protein n=1 Tax=Acidovorax sp. JMULE5 TaxID=2518343 RepID=UPI0015A01739|nr:putative Ig domain-containing protein [Acidovorax sp. JMULE5]